MGTGFHGGFGHTIGCSRRDYVISCKVEIQDVSLPSNEAQLNHIFGIRPGHFPDTPENRKRLVKLANDDSKYIGDDKYGNSWNSLIEPDGTQTWVRYRDGVINEGGSNKTPRKWDNDTGFNNNPLKGILRSKKNSNKGYNGRSTEDKGDNNK